MAVPRLSGWARLWIVGAIVLTPAGMLAAFSHDEQVWQDIDQMVVKQCVEEELKTPPGIDAVQCSHDRGAGKSFFEHQQVAPGSYWGVAFLAVFSAYCLATGTLAVAVYVGLWILRGFRPRGDPVQ